MGQGTTPEDLATQGRANASGALKGMFPSIEQENIDEFVENDFTEFMYGLSKGFSNLPFSEEASDFLKLEIDQSKANPDFNKNAEEMFKAFRAESEGLISPARAGELFSNIVWVLPVLQGTAGGFTRLKEATKKITSAVKEKGFDSVLRILNNTIKNKGVKESVNMIFSKNNNKNINTKIADNALKTMEKSLTPTKPTSQQIRQENFSARQASVKRNKETAMQRRREAEEAKALRQQQQEKPVKNVNFSDWKSLFGFGKSKDELNKETGEEPDLNKDELNNEQVDDINVGNPKDDTKDMSNSMKNEDIKDDEEEKENADKYEDYYIYNGKSYTD